MTWLTTFIVLSIFYGSGAVVCYTADNGHCGDRDETSIEAEK